MHRSGKTVGLIVILVVVLLVAGIIGYIDRPDQRHIEDMDPEVQLTADELILELTEEEKLNRTLRPDQVVEVFGSVKEINTLNNRQTIILDGDSDKSPYIICDMKSGQDDILDRLQAGDTVHLKGIFKGYLKDAIILNCVLTYYNEND